jgi:hypothetical protein
MDDPLKFGLYALLLLPGFIFVQTRDYHLLREQRSQFEKTLDIILCSAAIWIIASVSPVWLPCGARRLAFCQATVALRNSANGLAWSNFLTTAWGEYYASVCVATFLPANIWGMIRKTAPLDTLVEQISGRDWYPSVAKKFFDQNINQVVIVDTRDTRYMGILFGAPDTKDDPHIILSEVSRLPKPGEQPAEIEQLPLVRWVLVKFDDIIEIQALKPETLKPISKEER